MRGKITVSSFPEGEADGVTPCLASLVQICTAGTAGERTTGGDAATVGSSTALSFGAGRTMSSRRRLSPARSVRISRW